MYVTPTGMSLDCENPNNQENHEPEENDGIMKAGKIEEERPIYETSFGCKCGEWMIVHPYIFQSDKTYVNPF